MTSSRAIPLGFGRLLFGWKEASPGGYSLRMETDLAYFRRRASEEYLAYANSRHPAARQSHLQLARRYENRARLIEEDLRQTEIVQERAERDVIEGGSLWL